MIGNEEISSTWEPIVATVDDVMVLITYYISK